MRRLLAKVIHRRSSRGELPFVVLDLADIRTPIHGWPLPRLPRAATVFVAEIADLTADSQLLFGQLLEDRARGRAERTTDPSDHIHTEPRIVAGTAYDLTRRVQDDTFAPDLFYRLNTVHLVLPLADDATGRDETPNMLNTPDVLVVDDSLDRPDITGALKAGGYRVTSAATFEQATEIMARDPPDVLVTELRLGAFNGLHLIIRSRAHKLNTVAVIHTAHPDPVLEAEALRLNADYFKRPVDTPTLLAVIAQRLGHRPERRASSRRQINEPFHVTVEGSPAEIVDISDEGFRIEMRGQEIHSPLEISFPSLAASG